MTHATARLRFARFLEGRGLEIGALNRPTPVPRASAVVHSDYLSPDSIDRLYPGGTHPDILSDSHAFPSVANATFDFLIANHVLEHLTDPIRALREWHRIVRGGGLILLAVPDKRYTFDRKRRRTSLVHLLDDFRSPLSPKLKNLPHLLDWATYVEKLPPNSAEWARWVEFQFASDYSVHNHVWVAQDLIRLFLHLYLRHGTAFTLVHWANTATSGDEFAFLLRVRKAPGLVEQTTDVLRLCAAMGTACLQNPFQIVQAAAKTAYRNRHAAEA
jgi:SAM-dependent methyltransferase